jgi:hypothetical protein
VTSKRSHRKQLLAGGFRRIGIWRRDQTSDTIRLEIETTLRSEAGVYAHVVGHEVMYVGSSQQPLRKRLADYEHPSKTTTKRVRKEILALLDDGQDVEVFAIGPRLFRLNGLLPVDSVAGLEQGLIDSFKPCWNRRGTRKSGA